MRLRDLGLLALLGAGCMPPIHVTNAFSSRFGDNQRARIADVAARVGSAESTDRSRNGSGRPLVAAIRQGDARAVVVFDAQTGHALWTKPMAATSAPSILGDAVVVEVGAATHVLDLATGEDRGHVDHIGLEYAGADRDGDTIVMCFAAGLSGGTRRAGRVVAVRASNVGQRWEHEVSGIVGRPAARGGFAFVPWDRQNIAVIGLDDGVERARLRSTDDVLSWVFAAPEGVFYGGRGIYKLTPDSATGTRAGSQYLANPFEGIPGDPLIHRDGFQASTGSRTARDRIRFTFLPAAASTGTTLAVRGGTIFAAYYHDVLAVDATTGAVRWALRLDEDVEGMELTPAGLFVLSPGGRVRGIDPATGSAGIVANLGVEIGAVDMDVGGLALPAERTAPEGSAREQLVSLIRDADNRLVPFRSFLVSRLARLEDEEVTHDLLDLYTQRSIPVQLRQSIATALQSRRNGARFLVAALDEHFDYLENHSAPPLQVIAPTLVAMGAHDAVPGLTAHLLDHETPLEALPGVVSAIGTLGEGGSVPVLQRWLQLYRSDSSFRGAEHVVALDTAVDAIFHHGDASARTWLEQLQADTAVNALVRTHIAELRQQETSAAQRRQTQQGESERLAALQAATNQLHELQAAIPASLSDATFDEVWNAHLDEVRACAQGAVSRNPALNQIRVVVARRLSARAAGGEPRIAHRRRRRHHASDDDRRGCGVGRDAERGYHGATFGGPTHDLRPERRRTPHVHGRSGARPGLRAVPLASARVPSRHRHPRLPRAGRHGDHQRPRRRRSGPGAAVVARVGADARGREPRAGDDAHSARTPGASAHAWYDTRDAPGNDGSDPSHHADDAGYADDARHASLGPRCSCAAPVVGGVTRYRGELVPGGYFGLAASRALGL